MNINSLGKIVTVAAGTPVRVTTTPTPCAHVIVAQSTTALGKTYIGVAGMVVATGVGVIKAFLPAGTTGQSDSIEFTGPGDSIDLSQLWVDSATSGEGLHISYIVE